VRLLQRLDFDVIRRNPKLFIGFSDITALHIAIHQQTGIITFHAPNLQDGFGKADNMPTANEAALWRAVMGEGQPSAADGFEIDVTGMEGVKLHSVTSGVASGPLIGGNLAVLCGLMGTPFEIETAGRILFIEDVSERLYRIDRYLAQLSLAGKLQAAAGILVGTFSYEQGDHVEPAIAVDALLEEYLGELTIPVIAGFPAGHAEYNLTLPIGACVEIDADRCRVSLRESAVAMN
jgi:muramoyltetrapeptide carboxypeptidase